MLGGAETMYPEFRKKLEPYQPPTICVRYCCGWGGAPPGRTAPNVDCITGGSGDFLIQRCFIYLDPDYAGLDTSRYPWLSADGRDPSTPMG